jgi:hypothetical protein
MTNKQSLSCNNIENLTPHDVVVRQRGMPEYVYRASGVVARVPMSVSEEPPLPDGCPTVKVVAGEVNLPGEFDCACWLIVSTMYADAYRAQHGHDGIRLLVPDSGPTAIRDLSGAVVAVTRLIRR